MGKGKGKKRRGREESRVGTSKRLEEYERDESYEGGSPIIPTRWHCRFLTPY